MAIHMIPILIPVSVTVYFKIKLQGPTRMCLKYLLSLQVRPRFPLKLLFSNKDIFKRFSLFLSETLFSPCGWCNVKVDNFLSLELLKRSNVIDIFHYCTTTQSAWMLTWRRTSFTRRASRPRVSPLMLMLLSPSR